MRKQVSALAAMAILLIGGLSIFDLSARAQDMGSAGRVLTSATPQVRQMVSQVTSAAMQGNFSELADQLSEADRTRLGNQLGHNATISDRYTQFQQDWRAKYGQDFSATNLDAALATSGLAVYQGEPYDTARTASERIDAT